MQFGSRRVLFRRGSLEVARNRSLCSTDALLGNARTTHHAIAGFREFVLRRSCIGVCRAFRNESPTFAYTVVFEPVGPARRLARLQEAGGRERRKGEGQCGCLEQGYPQ